MHFCWFVFSGSVSAYNMYMKLISQWQFTGAVCGPASLVNSMMDLHQGTLMLLGPTMNPKIAFELSERIPHLSLRMKEHCHRALVFATRMKKLGLKVIYPGLEDHPHHTLLKSFANKDYGYGGLLCIDMETEERANKLMHHLQNSTQFGFLAVSLGYYETLMSCSGSSTSSEMNDEEKALARISPGLVRMSVGYLGTLEQRWSQLEKAISRMQDSGSLNKYWYHHFLEPNAKNSVCKGSSCWSLFMLEYWGLNSSLEFQLAVDANINMYISFPLNSTVMFCWYICLHGEL